MGRTKLPGTHYSRHRDAEISRTLAWQRANPDKVKASHYRNRYGISLDQLREMEIAQEGRCLICGCEDKLHVDHDHDTGIVRGLLCGNCNRALGILKEDLRVAEAMVAYIKERCTQ